MTALRKFIGLGRVERELLVRALAVVVLFRIAKPLLSFSHLRSLVGKLSGGSVAVSSGSAPDAKTIIWAVEASSARVPGGHNCLVRALGAETLLRRYGYTCDFKIGAGKTEAGEFTAHAWLECEGRVIIGDFELGRYAELTRQGQSIRAVAGK